VDKYISQQQYDTYVAQVAGLKGQLQVDQALLDTANISLNYTNITAPVDGMVGTYMINVGNVVKVNDLPITTIQTMSPIYADFVVSETDFPTLRQHFEANGGKLKATITSESSSKTQEEGELSILGNAIGTSTGTLSLRAVLPNEKHEFWPNQPVSVRILLETLPKAVLIPEGAVMLSQQGKFVFVVVPAKSPGGPSTVDKRIVETGQTQDNGLEVITSGLNSGEQVVVQGSQMMLMPGSSVSIKEMDGKDLTPAAPADAAGTAASATPASTAATGKN
jgi:multidrug efflux system membrane fusion protein